MIWLEDAAVAFEAYLQLRMDQPHFANARSVRNALDQSNKEIANRFDFKGSDARIEQKERELTAFADDDFKLGQVRDVLLGKFAKRGVDVRFLDIGEVQKIGGDKLKQTIKVKNGMSLKEALDQIGESTMGKQFTVNGKKVDIPSFRVTESDIVEVAVASRELTPFVVARAEAGERPVPAWIEVIPSKMRILVHQLPVRAQIDTAVQEQLIVELYSK
mgnify:CR=1 FL=1